MAPANDFDLKEILMEVRADIKDLARTVSDLSNSVSIMNSQNLDNRVNDLERWRDRADGRLSLLTVGVSFIGATMGIVGAILGIVKFING